MQIWGFLGFLAQTLVAGLTAAFPDQRWIGFTVLAVTAVLTVGFLAYPAFWQRRGHQDAPPSRLLDIGFGASLLFPFALGLGVWEAIPHYAERAELRLSFMGGNSNPTDQRLDNVEYWYAYHWPDAEFYQNADKFNLLMGQQWFIVVRFSRPVQYNRIQMVFSNQNHPPHEILSNDQKYILIAIHGEMIPSELDIYTESK